ncbi:unnamed protein product [Protopolystoma xenopodis]|uniref:Uncharacterized protein n=1 Tax=Protopolystoma xenopodis TaxID=117903 RepID=A0A448WY62_9PLAT|nr:unnamed protein product [Protopolystoma xenopodis]
MLRRQSAKVVDVGESPPIPGKNCSLGLPPSSSLRLSQDFCPQLAVAAATISETRSTLSDRVFDASEEGEDINRLCLQPSHSYEGTDSWSYSDNRATDSAPDARSGCSRSLANVNINLSSTLWPCTGSESCSEQLRVRQEAGKWLTGGWVASINATSDDPNRPRRCSGDKTNEADAGESASLRGYLDRKGRIIPNLGAKASLEAGATASEQARLQSCRKRKTGWTPEQNSLSRMLSLATNSELPKQLSVDTPYPCHERELRRLPSAPSTLPLKPGTEAGTIASSSASVLIGRRIDHKRMTGESDIGETDKNRFRQSYEQADPKEYRPEEATKSERVRRLSTLKSDPRSSRADLSSAHHEYAPLNRSGLTSLAQHGLVVRATK